MRAIARREGGKLKQQVDIRDHRITADEPPDLGGEDA